MLHEFLRQAKRVLQVARKPDQEEYLNVSKITALGITIMGIIGFIITLVANLVK